MKQFYTQTYADLRTITMVNPFVVASKMFRLSIPRKYLEDTGEFHKKKHNGRMVMCTPRIKVYKVDWFALERNKYAPWGRQAY